MSPAADAPRGPLAGVRVIDLSTVIAGPNCARYLADFGADVIKVERPDGGDTMRNLGWRDHRDGSGMWWKLVNRNKRTIVLDLKEPSDRDLLLSLVGDADVLIENFRPHKLENLGLGPEVLLQARSTLVITRITGFGQDGPYALRPGFATVAEAMCGLCAISGLPDGQPLLPPIALTDEVTALAAAFATLVALHTGQGQVVDVSLLETALQMMGPLVSLFEVNGALQPRMGSGLPYSVPRGTYRCSDGSWLALSASSDSVARRINRLLGVADDPRFSSFQDRMEHRDDLEDLMGQWCAARTRDDAMWALSEADIPVGPVLDMSDISRDPHIRSRSAIVEVGSTPMQGLIAKLSATPGVLGFEGRGMDADGEEIRRHGWGRSGAPA